MDAVYNEKDAVVILDHSEVRLIMKALDVLRYSDEKMNGSQLVNLAGLSQEWLCMTQDIGSPDKNRLSAYNDIERFSGKYIEKFYGYATSREVNKC